MGLISVYSLEKLSKKNISPRNVAEDMTHEMMENKLLEIMILITPNTINKKRDD
ncbi:MAG: hypothetical protein ACFE9R_12840 [Candidatus Hermodarchaeota archaeon]